VGDPLHHPGQVLAVAFRPDGRAVLTGCDDGAARLWTLAPAEPSGTPVPDADLRELPHLAHSPDGRTILMGHPDGTAQVRDAATMLPLGPPLRHEYAILSVAISPDGTRLLTGCVDGTVHVWSARTRQPIGRPLHHRGPVHSVAFCSDGRMVLTGSGDRTARLWDAATGKPIGMPLTHNAGVVAVAFSGTGDAVLTKTEDETVRRWERPAEASGPDERFALWAQVAIGAEIDANGTVRGLDASAWDRKWNRLRALGGVPRPWTPSEADRERDRAFQSAKEPKMCHDRWGTVTRRAALALLPWLCLATAGPGCSPDRPAPSGAAGTLDRLEKMRARRGTGDPRRQGERSSIPARQESGPR